MVAIEEQSKRELTNSTSDAPKVCNIYEKYQKIKATGGFPGILQNIIISLLGFTVILIVI